LPLSAVVDVPAAIPVRFTAEANAFVSKVRGKPYRDWTEHGACFFDYDGDGKPIFPGERRADGASLLLVTWAMDDSAM